MNDKQQLFETAVRDAVVVLTLMRKDVFAGPEFLAADESTDKAKAAGWAFHEIEDEARQRASQ
ncbi:hypothetical protein OG762_36825 [Streptomyces sp. NBC_01136]|uniref:hypothetical protein n=1 Tax=unclassified Streptomyces TaxID=2593676 RepID=UPI003254CF14|nr:hypothetical protein OG762_36825 [Streptomyces sp. NBC_01136]